MIAACCTGAALIFAVFAVSALPRRRREEPLRKEMHARPVTFRTRVDVTAAVLGIMAASHGRLQLTVRGDAFEVSHPLALARFLFGQEFCYRAGDTIVRVVSGLLRDCIEIQGQPNTLAARIRISRKNMNRQIWDALITAGAHPIGLSPSR